MGSKIADFETKYSLWMAPRPAYVEEKRYLRIGILLQKLFRPIDCECFSEGRGFYADRKKGLVTRTEIEMYTA